MPAVTELAVDVGTSAACQALRMPRASYYRDRRKAAAPPVASRPSPARALRPAEREAVLARLHEERFQDRSPAAVYATLLDEGEYLCSIRSMYRLLEERGESRERRDQLMHPPYKKPELLATAPNQLWSWDITKLLGPVKWTYFYLYVILDVFSRYVTGWMVAYRESAELAKRLIEESCKKQRIQPAQLTLHADRGTSMRSKPVALLLADLGVTKTHSRPYVSDDNPYSESQFRTLKYRPEFPDRFGCIQDSRAFCQSFFRWYNEEHRHSGVGLLTPATVHYGQAENILRQRQDVLDVAYQLHPERFVRSAPKPPQLPSEVWINKPVSTPEPLSTLEKRNALEKGQKRGCCGSTELAIVVARRSWREISLWKTGDRHRKRKRSATIHLRVSNKTLHDSWPQIYNRSLYSSKNEYGKDDQFLQSSQASERDHFLVGCLLRLRAHPQLARGARALLFPVLLRHVRDADCQPAFLDRSRRRPWGTIHPREAAARVAQDHRGRSIFVFLCSTVHSLGQLAG